MPNHNEPPQTQSTEEAISFIKDWATVEEFCELFPNIPEKTLRWQLTTREQNGLSPYVQVIGKKRYISIRGYATWLRENSGVSA
jgi:hypothetical protein